MTARAPAQRPTVGALSAGSRLGCRRVRCNHRPGFDARHFAATRRTRIAPGTTDSPKPERRIGLGFAIAAVAAVWFIGGLFGIQPLAISGPSMSPALHVGDLVVVQEVDVADIAVSDVISYRHASIDAVHRVIEVNNDRRRMVFITQGDANNTVDDPVVADRQIDRVIAPVPKAGWPSVFLRDLLSG